MAAWVAAASGISKPCRLLLCSPVDEGTTAACGTEWRGAIKRRVQQKIGSATVVWSIRAFARTKTRVSEVIGAITSQRQLRECLSSPTPSFQHPCRVSHSVAQRPYRSLIWKPSSALQLFSHRCGQVSRLLPFVHDSPYRRHSRSLTVGCDWLCRRNELLQGHRLLRFTVRVSNTSPLPALDDYFPTLRASLASHPARRIRSTIRHPIDDELGPKLLRRTAAHGPPEH